MGPRHMFVEVRWWLICCDRASVVERSALKQAYLTAAVVFPPAQLPPEHPELHGEVVRSMLESWGSGGKLRGKKGSSEPASVMRNAVIFSA